MYLLHLGFKNASKNAAGTFTVDKTRGRIRKWTQLPAGSSNRELLQLTALACGGPSFIPHLPFRLERFCRAPGPLHLECVLAAHTPGDCRKCSTPLIAHGVHIDHEGRVTPLRTKDRNMATTGVPFRKFAIGTGNSAYFFIAYGSSLKAHHGTDRFDFFDLFFRVTRFHSLFNPEAFITDPVAFLIRLNYRGILKARFPAERTMQCFCRYFLEYLDIDTGCWKGKTCNFEREWCGLHPWQQRALLPIIDTARHMMDAFPRSGEPLKMPGLMLLDRPDRFCTEKVLPRWIMLMDRLFPAMQFLLTLSEKARFQVPTAIQRKRLAMPILAEEPKERRIARLPRGVVLLLDVDSRLPNVALMKLSRYFKERGRRVILARKDALIAGAQEVYASSVFSSASSQKRLKKLREYYGKSLVQGGSGVDIHKRLAPYIEGLHADYSLYPELKDRAIGFLTRGCPGHCAFCIVPAKEGKPRQVSDLDTLLEGGRFRKLILLDDNILSYSKAGDLLEEMVSRDIRVNFTQTLDIRLLNREKAHLLRRIHAANTGFTRCVYHFSLNNTRSLEQVRRKYRLMGFSPRDNVEFVCMYGYDTTLAEDVERFRFLRSLPGAYVFVQEYQPILGGPTPDLTGFFDYQTDEHIDKLITIMFSQNMKSMEKYYRWLSKRYVQTFGKLHRGLVDTIFRYNYRDHKGRYIARMMRPRKN
jgi:hypothetical protein